MKWTQRDRRAVTIGAICLAAVLLLKFAIWPALDHWRQLAEDRETNRQHLLALDRKLKQLERLQSDLQTTHGPAIDKPLATVDHTRIAFHKTIQELLKTTGVQSDSIDAQTVRKVREIPGSQLVPYRITGKCQIAQLAKLLAEVRKADSLVIVDRLNVTPNAKNPAELNVVMVLTTLATETKPS